MTRRRRRAGFSLIEMLVVFVVIGLLIAIAVPRYQHHVAEVRQATTITTARNLVTALELAVQGGDRQSAGIAGLTIDRLGVPVPDEVEAVLDVSDGRTAVLWVAHRKLPLSCLASIGADPRPLACQRSQVTPPFKLGVTPGGGAAGEKSRPDEPR